MSTTETYTSISPKLSLYRIREAQGFAHGDQGYPTTVPGIIEITPLSVLVPENWYDLRILSLPSDVVPGGRGLHKSEDGVVSSRFSRGSHLTLVGARRCEKKDGSTMIYIDFSESLTVWGGGKGRVRVELDESTDACTLVNPAQPATPTLRFNCRLNSGKMGRFRISVDGDSRSPSGSSFAMLGRAGGSESVLVEDTRWERYEDGCSKVEFQ